MENIVFYILNIVVELINLCMKVVFPIQRNHCNHNSLTLWRYLVIITLQYIFIYKFTLN